MVINIAMDYTKTPGGRLTKEGAWSGEDFRIKKLEPAYKKAKELGENLTIVLDGGYGYATSFLEEAFGGLARELKDPDILNITIVSDEEPVLIKKIRGYILDALKESR